MAGKPKRKALNKQLVELAKKHGVDRDEHGKPLDDPGMGFVSAWHMGLCGEFIDPMTNAPAEPTIRALCRVLGCSEFVLNDWLRQSQYRDARKEALRRAREVAATGHAERALELVDQADPRASSLALVRARFRQWLAGIYNRAEYSLVTPPAAPTVNVAQMFVMAQRDRALPNERVMLPNEQAALPNERAALPNVSAEVLPNEGS